MREQLTAVIPSVCKYFKNDEFKQILDELEFYHSHVEEHFQDFENTRSAWVKIMKYLEKQRKLV